MKPNTDSVQAIPDVHAVDSSEVDGSQSDSFIKQLLQRMSPKQCLAPSASSCTNPLFDDPAIDFDTEIPPMLKDIKHEGKLRTAALQRLYRMTDRDRKQNRVPIVCTTKFSVFEAIEPCLSPDASATDRRQALLLINNLSIPNENKAAILLGEPIEFLLPPLLRILRKRLPESYLAAVCLFNLSFLEDSDAKAMLMSYVPTKIDRVRSEYKHQLPAENEDSLLRVVESMLKDFTPYLKKNVRSVQAEAVRWSMGLMRNLVTNADNAVFVAQNTVIPSLAVKYLRDNTNDLVHWTRDSLPDSSLMLLVHLVKFDECLDSLNTRDTREALKQLEGRGGIHEMRASAVLCRLQGEETYQSLSCLVDEKKE